MKSIKNKHILTVVLGWALVITSVMAIGTTLSRYVFSDSVGSFSLEVTPRVTPAEAIMGMVPEGGNLTRIVYDYWDNGYTDSRVTPAVTISAEEWLNEGYKIYDPNQSNIRMFAKQHDGDNYTVYVLSAEDIFAPSQAARMFSGAKYGGALQNSVTEIVLHNFYFPQGAFTSFMFNGCNALTSLDMSGMDFTPINSAKESNNNPNSGSRDRMFWGMAALTNMDLSNTTWSGKMGRYFYRSGYSANLKAIQTIDLRGANTQKVTDFTQMFLQLYTLVNVYGLDQFVVADNVTSVSEFFSDCQKLSCDTLKDFAKLLTKETQIKNFAGTFTSCDQMDNETFHILIAALAARDDDSKISSLDKAFQRCNVSGAIDISSLDLSMLTSNGLRQTFFDCASISSVTFPNSIGGATSLQGTFKDCFGLTTVDMSEVDTSNVTNMTEMFYRCSALTTVCVGDGWSTNQVTNSTGMFTNCTRLVGGNGTVFDSTKTDKEYARIDGGSASETPGYFTQAGSSVNVISESIGVTVDVSDVSNALVTSNGESISEMLYTRDGVICLDIETDEGYVLPDTFRVNIDGTEYLLDAAGEDNLGDIRFDKELGSLFIPEDYISQGSLIKIQLVCVEDIVA